MPSSGWAGGCHCKIVFFLVCVPFGLCFSRMGGGRGVFLPLRWGGCGVFFLTPGCVVFLPPGVVFPTGGREGVFPGAGCSGCWGGDFLEIKEGA